MAEALGKAPPAVDLGMVARALELEKTATERLLLAQRSNSIFRKEQLVAGALELLAAQRRVLRAAG